MAATEHDGIRMLGPLMLERLSVAPTGIAENRGRVYHDTVILKVGLQLEDDSWEYISYFPAAYKVLVTEDVSQFDVSSLGVWSYNAGAATFQNETLGAGATEIDYFQYSGGHRIEDAIDVSKALPAWSAVNAHHAFIPSHAALRIGTVSGTEWDTVGLRSVVIGEDSSVTAENSAVIAGSSNSIAATREDNAIIGANAQTIDGTSRRSVIIGGTGSTISNGDSTGIFGGGGHTLSGFANTILGGAVNQLGAGGATESTVVGGREIDMSASTGLYQSTLGGYQNTLSASGTAATIVGGTLNTISGVALQSGIFAGRSATLTGRRSAIIAGDSNQISPSGNANECAIVAGSSNTFSGSTFSDCVILGGNANDMDGAGASFSAILAGTNNTLTGTSYSVIAGGSAHTATADYAGVFCGAGNTASATYAVVVGGVACAANAIGSAIFGGTNCSIASGSELSVIVGGNNNDITSATSLRSAIVGGTSNQITASGFDNAILGGDTNVISGTATGSIILGGDNNTISSSRSFAMGDGCTITGVESIALGAQSVATNNSFIFASAGLTSATDDVFGVQASNGLYFSKTATGTVSITAGRTIDTDTGGYLTDAGVWQSTSSIAAKQAFEDISPLAILEKVLSLNVTEWEYKKIPGIRHIGPMSEEFSELFKIGDDERALSPIDTVGVALAAIQGLKQYVDEVFKQKK